MSNKPRWIQNADGSIFHIDTRATLCGHVGHQGTRCTRNPGHTPAIAHQFERQYPGPNPGKSKADQFLGISLDPVIDPPYPGPKPSAMYPHDMDLPPMPAWKTHPGQLRYASSRQMMPDLGPDIARSELHYMIDQLYDHASNTGQPIDLATLKLEAHTDEATGRLSLRISATTKAPTTD